MNDLNEKLRRFFRIAEARADKSYEYWRRVPAHRLGDEFMVRTQKLLEAIMTGKGDPYELGAETMLVILLLCDNSPRIQEILNQNKKEFTVQQDREGELEDERKRKSKSGGKPKDWWRG